MWTCCVPRLLAKTAKRMIPRVCAAVLLNTFAQTPEMIFQGEEEGAGEGGAVEETGRAADQLLWPGS